jgi:hypothetical protein
MKRCTIPLILSLLALPLVFSSSTRADENDGFESLFDGETLEGWSGDSKFWSVEDGLITGRTTPDNPTQGNTFLLREGDFGDFELRLKYRIVGEGGNSGVQYRSQDLGDFVVGGYQADFESGDRYNGILYEERGRGILALRGQEVVIHPDGKKEVVGKTCDEDELVRSINKEDWNEYVIIAKGNELKQVLNGHVSVKVTDHEEDKRAMSGIIAVQLHAGPPMLVQFRDIRIKKLD